MFEAFAFRASVSALGSGRKLQSETLAEVSTPFEGPTKISIESTSTNALETVFSASKSDDANHGSQGVEKEMEPGSAPEHEDDSIATALQMMIANGVKLEVADVLVSISKLVKKAV